MPDVIEISNNLKSVKTESNRNLVSICIPAYNSEQYLAETLDCLFNQTYKNIEIIVVDDGSSDNTGLFLNTVKEPRLKFVSQVNKGAAAARNKAFELSSGQFIKFLDADDLINPAAIEQQLLTIIDKPDCIASSKWGRFFNNDVSTFKFTPEYIWKDMAGVDWVVDSLIEHGSNMTQPGIFLIPRKLIEKFGLWKESLSLIDDFEFMTRLIVNSKLVLFCEEAVLMYRSGLEGSLSRSNSIKHMQSAYTALTFGVNEILKVRNDSTSRLACCNLFQLWVYTFYPDHKHLYQQIEDTIKSLGGSTIKMRGGRYFVLMSKVLGWKKTVLFKRLVLKLLRKKDFNSFRL